MAKTVLLIEDEVNIIEALSFILSRDGWDVVTHSNGHDANEVITQREPDLVVLDVMLPGKSGFDILRDLRRDPRHQNRPVLMLTARGQSKDRDMAEQLGVSKFMTKPFSNTEVRDAVNELLSGCNQSQYLNSLLNRATIAHGAWLMVCGFCRWRVFS